MSTPVIWVAHGLLGAIAVFITFPLGIIWRRTRVANSWVSHSLIQSIGIALVFAGVGIGLLQNRKIDNTHHYAGLATAVVAFIQLVSGLLAREVQIDTQDKHSIRSFHAIQGFTCIVLGWFSCVTGLVLASWNSTIIIIVTLLTAIEIATTPVLCVLISNKSKHFVINEFPKMSKGSAGDEAYDDMLEDSEK